MEPQWNDVGMDGLNISLEEIGRGPHNHAPSNEQGKK